MVWLADDLDSAVRRLARIPSGSSAMSQTDVLALADEEIDVLVGPMIDAAREDYGLKYEEDTLVVGTSKYRIPERATLSTLREVKLRDTNGAEVDLVQTSIEDKHEWEGNTGTPTHYFFEGQHIVLCPSPSSASYTLRMYFVMRPSKLVLASAAMAITGVASLKLSGTPPASFTTNDKYDVVQGRAGFDTLMWDETATSVTTGVTLVSTPSTSITVEAGTRQYDYVALARQSPVVQLPDAWHTVLARATAVRVLEAIKHYQAMGVAQAKLEADIQRVQNRMTPRNSGQSKKVVSKFSPLRSA